MTPHLPAMSAITERETLSVVRTTPGSWDGTFHVVLGALLADVLSDGPLVVRLRHLDGREITGNLVDFTDQTVVLETGQVRLVVDRDEIISVTI